jgi:hypothetical protein
MKIVDAHAFIGENLFGRGQSVPELLRNMEACGIDQAVIAPHRPPQYALWPANQMVGEALKAHPDRFFGLARLDPWQGLQALEDLRRAHQEFGVKGLLLHPWEEVFQVSSHNVDPLVEYAVAERLFVVIEAGYPLLSHPLDIAELAHRHPNCTFIGTHGLQLDSAGFALTDAELAMRECPNLIMETSGMYAPETMENLVRDLGTSRLVFGSHSPWLNLRLEVERARLLNLSPDQLQAVLGENILKLVNA